MLVLVVGVQVGEVDGFFVGGMVLFEDCEWVSCDVLVMFDVVDLVVYVYQFEVSFLGFDWLLWWECDFVCFEGEQVWVCMIEGVEGWCNFIG